MVKSPSTAGLWFSPIFSLLIPITLAVSTLAAQVPLAPKATIAEEQDYAFAYGLYKDGLFQLAGEELSKFIDRYPSSLKQPDAHFLRTECLFQQEQYDLAVKGFADFVRRFPSSNMTDNAYFRLGDTNVKLKKTDDAISAYKAVMEGHGESPLAGEAAYWIGELFFKQSEYEKAAKYYLLSYENYPNNRLRDFALYSVAWTNQRRGDHAKAATTYRKVVQEFPQSSLTAASKVRIGECYYHLKEYKHAIEELSASRSTIEPADQKAEADYLIAESFYHLNEFESARKEYEAFLGSYPGHKLTREVRYTLGWTMLKQKDFSKAAETFGTLVDTSDALAHAALYRKGVSEKLQGNREIALRSFTRAFADHPNGDFADNALFDAGMILFEQKKSQEAQAFFSRLVKEYPASDVVSDSYQMLAESLIGEGDYEGARAAFQSALTKGNPPFEGKVTSSYQVGWCLYKLKKYKEAARQFSGFIETYPQHPRSVEAKYWLAESEYGAANYRAALKQYQAIADKQGHARREEGMYGVGWSNYRLNDYNKAITAFERLVATYPSGKFSFDARLRLGDSYFYLKDYRKAAGVYRAVVRLFPKKEETDYAYYQLAQSYFRMNDHEQATQQFTSLITTVPKSALADDAQYALGWIQFQKKQYEEAIKEFQKLSAMYPESELIPRTLYSLGDAYYNLKRFTSAEESYREVLRRFPKSTYVFDAINGLQYCLVAQGKQDDAIAVIDSYIKENSGSQAAEQLSLKKGDLLYGQKQFERAATAYREFVERYPQSIQRATALYWLAKSLDELNKISEAAAAYEQAASTKSASEKIVANALIDAISLYLKEKNYQQAFIAIGKAEKELGASEWAPEVAYLKATVFWENGALEEAKNQFEFVASRYGSTIQADKARVGLAKIHLRNQEYTNAQMLTHKVATSRIDEVGAEAQYLSGVTYSESKEWQSAITAFLRMRYVFPSHETWLAKAYLGLGAAYEEIRNLPKAREAYQNALKLRSEGETGDEATRRLKNLERF